MNENTEKIELCEGVTLESVEEKDEEKNLLPREYTPEEQEAQKKHWESEKEKRKTKRNQVTIYPEGKLLDLIEESAKRNKRSINSEILLIVERHYKEL